MPSRLVLRCIARTTQGKGCQPGRARPVWPYRLRRLVLPPWCRLHRCLSTLARHPVAHTTSFPLCYQVMDGILLVDKPAGRTSFDVVGRVRRMVSVSGLSTSNKKRFPVGHTGTLDPLATGLLVLLLGSYTKHAPMLTKM